MENASIATAKSACGDKIFIIVNRLLVLSGKNRMRRQAHVRLRVFMLLVLLHFLVLVTFAASLLERVVIHGVAGRQLALRSRAALGLV